MSEDPKVLTGLLERRAIEAAFAELAETDDPELRVARAEAIAERGEAALAALLALLDTRDPALRGRLGLVATLLPREQVVPALQTVARSRDRSDQARVAAVSLLERYLDEHTDGTLVPLSSPNAAALQSLSELVFAMEREPLAILEFMEQLAQQPPEVPGMLLDAVPAAAESLHLVTLLRMFAQETDGELAGRALDQLGRIRTPAAARALAALRQVLPPGPAGIAERNLRKLRFSGVPEDAGGSEPPWDDGGLDWRVLLSPVDPAGTQFVWFIGRGSSGTAVFLSLLLHEPTGIASAAGALDMPADRVPDRVSPGYVLSVEISGQPAPVLTLVEAPFCVGLEEVRGALQRNWEGTSPPLPFRLFNSLIFSSGAGGEPAPVDTPAPSTERADVLLDNPLFAGWFAEERRALAHGAAVERVFTDAICASYIRRLHSMARWLTIARETDAAALALGLAEHLTQVPSGDSRFIARLYEPLSDSAQ